MPVRSAQRLAVSYAVIVAANPQRGKSRNATRVGAEHLQRVARWLATAKALPSPMSAASHRDRFGNRIAWAERGDQRVLLGPLLQSRRGGL